MELFLQITAAILMTMMVFFLWPVYKRWQEQGPKAEKGDWPAALLPLGGVVLFVILLVMAVR